MLDVLRKWRFPSQWRVAVSAGRKIPAAPYKGLVPYTDDDAALFFGRMPNARLLWRIYARHGLRCCMVRAG